MKKLIAVMLAGLLAASALAGCGNKQEEQYNNARNLFNYGQYSEARKAFKALDDYSDSKAMVTACDYQLAMVQISHGEYIAAAAAFAALGNYENAYGMSKAAESLAALQQYEAGDTDGAISGFKDTKLGKDLQVIRDGGTDLTAVVGSWACTMDLLPEVQEAVKSQADENTKEFAEGAELKDLSVKISLQIDTDGLAHLCFSGEEWDRTFTSLRNQLRKNAEAYADAMVEHLTEEEEISEEELFEEYEVDDAEGVFQAELGMNFEELERKLMPEELFNTMYETYNGAGITLAEGASVRLRFPEHQWSVDSSVEGKLTLTDGTNTLTLTRLS